MVDAVVVTAGSRELVLRCLERLDGPELERIVVVDNASADGTADAIGRRFDAVELIRLETRVPLAAAYNRGAGRGVAPYVLFLNDDVFAQPASVGELVAVLQADQAAVAAAGRLVDPDTNSTQPEYRPRTFPTVTTFVAALAGLDRRWPTNPWTGGHRRRPLDEGQPSPVEHAVGACLLVRRAVFEAVGGWDEGYELWFEDVDLSRRLRQRGRVLYVPAARFQHVGGASASRLSRADLVARYQNGALRYGRKHFSRAGQVGLGFAFLTAAGIRAATTRRDPQLSREYSRVARNAAALIRGRLSTAP